MKRISQDIDGEGGCPKIRFFAYRYLGMSPNAQNKF